MKVQCEDPATSGCSRGDRVKRYVGKSLQIKTLGGNLHGPSQPTVHVHYSPFPGKRDSKWPPEWKLESGMVITGLFSTGFFEKKREL